MIPIKDQASRGQQLVARLQEAGYRLTPQRLALVELLAADLSHPSAEQVYTRMKAIYPTISLATVYNTLEMLVELGEALPLDCHEGCMRFDVRRPAAHPHLICRTCGQIEDLDLEGIDRLLDAARAGTRFRDLQARVYFDGVCPRCIGVPGPTEEAKGA